MSLFLLSFLIIGFAMLGMALGLFVGKPAIRRGCGSVNPIEDDGVSCDICGKDISRKRLSPLATATQDIHEIQTKKLSDNQKRDWL